MGDKLQPQISLGPDNIKHYRQFKNAVFGKHEIMPKVCHLKFQHLGDRNDLNLRKLQKNLKLHNYIRKSRL